MEAIEDLDFNFNLLLSVKKIERDQGASKLDIYLNSCTTEGIHTVVEFLLSHLESSDAWESIHGSLIGSKTLLSKLRNVGLDDISSAFVTRLYDLCLKFLTHEEVRIRWAAGEVLGEMCRLNGPKTFENARSYLFELIQDNLERDSKNLTENEDDDYPRRHSSSDAAQIFHDTAGWKFLETSMKCLQFMVEGCGESFERYITEDFLALIFKTLSHTNRFVRETGYYVLGTLVACSSSLNGDVSNPFSAERFGHHICKQLGVGLSDNWSQVRLASSECTRKFLLSFKTDNEREEFFPELLPKMCLNRYYIADGVRIYSQESWNQIVKGNGRAFVQKHIGKFVDHYISQTKADNHAVREAACACIAEIASKIDQESVKPHVSRLLNTLLVCFSDDSWPVRDAACLACGNFILCYPDESRCSLDKLYDFFFVNLKDSIPSVRQGAAAALTNVVKAYGVEAFENIKPRILDGFQGLEKQPSESEKYGEMDKGPTTFGVAKRLRDNDMELHTDKIMYSCGSLAPKMGRGGGCSDHKFSPLRPPSSTYS